MRSIGVDNMKIGISEKTNTDSEASRFIDIIDRQPTAFDLEGVIEQINNAILPTECYRHRFCENMTAEHCVEHEDCEFCIAEMIIEILKSATNLTNGDTK